MWTVVYVSQDKPKVDRILSVLDQNQIMTMLKMSGEDESESCAVYEILVPQTELETAQDIIVDAELDLKN